MKEKINKYLDHSFQKPVSGLLGGVIWLIVQMDDSN
jgi:hypothetical protein